MKMETKKVLTILYGSQTGTAEEMSWQLRRLAKLRGIQSCSVLAMDSYNISNLLKEEFVIFICSTMGLGEEPDNMKKFWKFLLRKSLPQNSLAHLSFGVLGLGDSSYSKFNYPAKKLNKRLIQLGATQLLNMGLCDYQHDLGHDAVFEPWCEELWTILDPFFPGVKQHESQNINGMFLPKWEVLLSPNSNPSTEELYFENIEPTKTYLMNVKSNRRTTAENHFQDVRLIEFANSGNEFDQYKPGDVLNLRPKNSDEAVDIFFRLFGDKLKRDDVIEIKQIDADVPIPNFLQKPLTLGQIVREYFDLSAIPKKYAFSVMAHFSEDTLEKGKCLEFCTPEGQEDFFNYCNRPRRNILEVLEDFHNTTPNLTLQGLFELFTPIKPRSFSIASSSAANDNKSIEILVAVVKYYTKMKKERLGLCSNWLKNLKTGDGVQGWITKGTFVFPVNKDIPVMMIGPGTGLAPFRNYILEKNHFNEASEDKLILFFGCRNKLGDFHSRDELERLQSSGKLTLICAFSRDQDHKIYVQHKIEEHARLVWKHLSEDKGVICIAGNAKNMPNNVKDSIIESALMKLGNMDKNEAKAYLEELETNGRLQMETW